jgi:hypothetical protein
MFHVVQGALAIHKCAWCVKGKTLVHGTAREAESGLC